MNFQSKDSGIPWPPLVVLICLIFVYAFFFGPSTWMVWRAKQEAAHDPGLALVPTPLRDTSISTTPGTMVTLFGYQFEVPWQGPVAAKNSGDGHLAVIYSASGNKRALMFFNPANNRGLVETAREALKTRGEDPSSTNAFLDAHSDYDLTRSILYATPAQLSLVFPGKKEVYAATRLMMKQTEEQGIETGLYSFEIGRLRGFQTGDPSRTRNIRIEAFDDEDRRFVFSIGCKPDATPCLKQTDINRVLQKLEPVLGSPQ